MIVHVRVHAGSRKELLTQIGETSYELWVREKPERNEANGRVSQMLAVHFKGCRGVKLLRGSTRPTKTFEILEPVDSLFEQ